MRWENVVTTDPGIMSGTPVFRGTRVLVESLVQHRAAGDSLADFLEGFPGVEQAQAAAFLQLAFDAAVEPLMPEVNRAPAAIHPGEVVHVDP